jgi:hypothetical protein
MRTFSFRLPAQSPGEPNCQFPPIKYPVRKEVTQVGCGRAFLRREKFDDFLRTVAVLFFSGPLRLPCESLKRFDAQWIGLSPEGGGACAWHARMLTF